MKSKIYVIYEAVVSLDTLLPWTALLLLKH